MGCAAGMDAFDERPYFRNLRVVVRSALSYVDEYCQHGLYSNVQHFQMFISSNVVQREIFRIWNNADESI